MEIGVKKKIDDAAALKVSKMKPVIKPTKPHKHAGYHELIFLSAGAGEHTIDDHTFDVTPFSGFYLKPGQVHCWDFARIPAGYVVLFREEILAGQGETLNSLYRMPSRFDLPEQTNLFPLLSQFYDHFRSNGGHRIQQAYLNLVLLKTIDLAGRDVMEATSITGDFYVFKKLVNEHYLELRQVTQYAALMHTTVKRLNSICRAAMRSSASDIIKERILTEAKNHLTHTSKTISEIAYGLNFSDNSNFVKFFKSLTALTPSQYRARTSP
jgi:AraC-like DNA-binding protein